MKSQRIEYYPDSRGEWRNWLRNNYDQYDHVWLILYKQGSGVPSISYEEVVEECLCFGWIDSKPNKRDNQSYYLYVTPRKSGSVWSALNKKRIDKLLMQKKIRGPGMLKIEQAKKDGSWFALDAVEQLKIPDDLEQAFVVQKKAKTYFDAFPASVRKQLIYWITSAKTEATRSKRIAETVAKARENIRANQWTPKNKR